MSRVHPVINAFNSGEWSGRLAGRTDLAKYNSSCTTIKNCILHAQGGAQRSSGTRYVAEVKTSSAKTRLVRFEFSTTQAYMLEFGNLYIRFFRNGAAIGAPYEVVTTYVTADLFDLQFHQSADTLYIVHQSYPPKKLLRYGHADWKLKTIVFAPPPSIEYGARPNTTLTPAAVTGSAITFTAGAASFLVSDVGRELVSGSARALITAFTDTTHVDATITDDFPSTAAIAAGSWFVSSSPKTTCTPGAAGPVGLSTSLTLAANGWQASAQTTDIGKFVHCNGGVFEITAIGSALGATATIRSIASSTTAAPSGAWSLEENAFSALNGYPATITAYEDRLVLAGSVQQPDTFWMSKSSDYENFAAGTQDDDAIEYRLGGSTVSSIVWLSSAKQLYIGTIGGESRAFGGQDAPITPSNINVKSSTSYGGKKIQPLRVGGAALFLQRSGKKLREFTFDIEQDEYVAPDMTILAEHVSVGGFTQLAYAQEPDSIMWVTRADGVLCGLTYQRDQDVVGWHRRITGYLQDATDGLFESVAVIPHPDGDRDQVWVIVKRTIGGATKRYVEYVDDKSGYYGVNATYADGKGGLQADSTLIYSGVATVTVTGLAHLNGETVDILGDGAVYPQAVVSGGSVTLNGPAATLIEVGIPYQSTLIPNRPEGGAQSGTAQGLPKRWSNIKVRVKDTSGLTINGDMVPYRTANDLMGDPPALRSEDRDVTNLGWDTDAFVTMQQTLPLPFTVLMVTGTLTIGEG